jgi:hypothetical protein
VAQLPRRVRAPEWVWVALACLAVAALTAAGTYALVVWAAGKVLG